MWGKGLLDHTPVPQMEILPIREDLGIKGSSYMAGTWYP